MFANFQDVKAVAMNMFTDDEWNAIYDAMAEYQDHGEVECDLAYSVQEKITALFNND
tara:strand:- start:337 stop:507 length:171 start_codon:yes stop_codon:yes gene_type:complete